MSSYKPWKKNYYSTYSSSAWEESFFGGYFGLIRDHPEISLDFKVDIKVTKPHGLMWWMSEKLIKIFLLKVKEHGAIKHLMEGAEIKETSKYGIKNKSLVLHEDTIKETLAYIAPKDSEYRALFEHYSELITTAEISMKIPEGNGKGNSGSGSSGSPFKPKSGKEKNGEGKSKGGGKSEEKQEDQDEDSEESSDNGGEKDNSRGEAPLRYAEGEERLRLAKEILRDYLGEIKKREVFNGTSLTGEKAIFLQLKDGDKCRFSDEQKFYAGQLLKMLDISFDPTSDRINSLRTGILDSRKLAEVLPGNTNIYYKVEENQTTKPFSVVLLQDESGSMGEYQKINHSINVLKTLYLAFSEILPPEKLYVYGHSGIECPKIYVYQDRYNPKFEERIGKSGDRNYNYDGPAIEAIYEKIREVTDDNIILISLSDGQPCGSGYGGISAQDSMKRVLEKCRRDGFVTLGIGIKHFNDPGLYNYSCIIKNLGDDMIKKTSHLINKVVKTEFQ